MQWRTLLKILLPPLWLDLSFDMLERAESRHSCGGHFQQYAWSGLFAHRVHERCDRCGAERSYQVEY